MVWAWNVTNMKCDWHEMGPTWNGTNMKWPPLAWIRTDGHEMGPTWNGTGMKWDTRTWNGTDMKWDGHEMARHDLANMIWADMKWPGMKWDIPSTSPRKVWQAVTFRKLKYETFINDPSRAYLVFWTLLCWISILCLTCLCFLHKIFNCSLGFFLSVYISTAALLTTCKVNIKK